MIQTVTIEFDTEKKTINKLEGTDNVPAIDIAKILISIGMSALNKVDVKDENIKVVKPKIIV